MEINRTTVEAASWAIAAYLSPRLDDRFTLIEGHPAGGQTDILWWFDRTAPFSGRNEVRLCQHLGGAIQIVPDDGIARSVGGADVWERLASGAAGVVETANDVLGQLGLSTGPRARGPRDKIFLSIAATLRRAALFGLPWRCLWGVEDTAGYGSEDGRAHLFQPYLSVLAELGLEPGGANYEPEKYWFIVSDRGEPIAAFDTDGYIHLPASNRIGDLTGDQYPPPEQTVDDLFSSVIRTSVAREAELPTGGGHGLGLPAKLSAFTRKERLFLFGFASGALDEVELHSPAMRLDSRFRAALGTALGLDIPAHAWASVDFHLSWLHAALQWHKGVVRPGQLYDLPYTATDEGTATDDNPAWITGSQEDADLIVVWTANGRPQVVLLEAKAYGAWSNKQALSKVKRVGAIRTAAGGDVDLRLVLSSPARPQKLDLAQWPEWAVSPKREPYWLRLPVPRLRVATERCDPHGFSDSEGVHWRIAGPLA